MRQWDSPEFLECELLTIGRFGGRQSPRETSGIGPLNDSQEQCLNCGATLVEGSRFCHSCGQKIGPRRSTIRELFAEFFFSIIQVDGKFLLTLRYLLLKPGFLTQEYRAGKKVRYLRPLTITTILAGVFFVMLEWNSSTAPDSVTDGLAPGETVRLNLGPGVSIGMTAKDLEALSNATYEERLEFLQLHAGELGPVQKFLGERALRLIGDGGIARFQQGIFRMVSRTLVFLIPAFGFVVLLLNWRRKRDLRPYYSETIVYSLHVHSFLFVLLTIAQIPFWSSIQLIIWGLSFPLACWYMAASMRATFNGSWLISSLKGFVALLVHIALTLIVSVVFVLLVLAVI